MGFFSCPRCSYETSRLPDYKKHISRKTECLDINNSGVPFSELFNDLQTEIQRRKESHVYTCEECGKNFTTSQLKYVHKQRVHAKPLEVTTETNNTNLVELVEKLQRNPTSVQQNVTINIFNNTINNVININAFGNENYLHVLQNKKRLIQMFLNKAPGYIKLAEDIFFHKDHPENRNVRIKNKKLPYAECYDGEKWLTRNQKNVLIEMINTVKNILDEYVTYNQQEIRAFCNSSLFSAATTFLNNLKDAINTENLNTNQMKMLKGIINDMKILVMNNS